MGGKVVVDVAEVVVEVDAVAIDVAVVLVVVVGGKVVVDIVVVMVEVEALAADVAVVLMEGSQSVVGVVVVGVFVVGVELRVVVVDAVSMGVSLSVTVKRAGLIALLGLTVSILLVVCLGILLGMAFVEVFGRFLAEKVMVAIRKSSLCVVLL